MPRRTTSSRPHRPARSVGLLAALACVAGLLAAPATVATASTGTAAASAVKASQKAPVSAKRQARTGGISTVSAGGEFSCGIRRSDKGSLWCWGRNTYGQVGNGSTSTEPVAPTRVGTGSWLKISAGGSTACGIRSDRALLCWGLNHRGQVGDGTTKTVSSPKRVAPKTKGWAQVDTGWFHTCGITTEGRMSCWGDNSHGQLGDGTRKNATKPRRVAGTGWRSVTVGGWSTCATKTDFSLWCWGRNNVGQLGVGDQADRLRPTRVGTSKVWGEVSLSWTHGCGRQRSGVVRCWGRNDRGQVGASTAVYVTRPARITGAPLARSIATAEATSCIVGTDSSLWCWGDDRFGQLGDGVAAAGTEPTPKRRAGQYSTVSGGWLHVCATTRGSTGATGSVCWGDNTRGQLGDQVAATRPAPTPKPSKVRRDGPLTLRLATLNVLGNGHTRPYAHDDQWGPSRLRADWTTQALTNNAVDVVGVQEPDVGQLAALVQGSAGRLESYPTTDAGDLGVESTVMWDRTKYEFVEGHTIRTQHFARKLPRPYVRLRQISTGREFWVFAIHNAPNTMQAKRNEAMKVQIAKIKQLEATGLPVFFVGDFNERQVAYCKVLSQTGLESAAGGRIAADGTCMPPRSIGIDQMFGSRAATWTRYVRERPPLVTLSTDHPLWMVDVTVP